MMAFDAYNGLPLWHRDIPGAMRPNASHDGSNLAISADGLFVAVNDTCLRLDPVTGQTRAIYNVAKSAGKGRWGYVACAEGLLYGSCSTAKSVESDSVFAIDPSSGQRRWTFGSSRIPHNTISIDGGRMFLIDSNVEPAERDRVIARKTDAG